MLDRMRPSYLSGIAMAASVAAGACALIAPRPDIDNSERTDRSEVLARAQVWQPTNVRARNLRRGPDGPGAFAAGAVVRCEYVEKRLSGASPKFACRIGSDDEVKVKFGPENAEVYGEVLATRLLWALGFGADRMYPVRVVCRGCPRTIEATEMSPDVMQFDPAVIERKIEGTEWPAEGPKGWSWEELDRVDPERGGAPRAHRDALKLLAVFLQHSDSKAEQQRIVCVDAPRGGSACSNPFLMISDVGLTFGRANRTNSNESGVNLSRWRRTPVWKEETGCVGHLPKSLTGTLHDPVISEQGRRFLADLLVQLSDVQLRDLFSIARVELRQRQPGDPSEGFGTIGEWVDAFKDKRAQIVRRRCA